jgi:hexokinase
MKNNIFDLTTEELKKIAESLEEKIDEGLKKDKMEIRAIPTHISAKDEIPDGRVLALDWGGTNFRAAIVEYKDGNPTIIDGPVKRELNAETVAGSSRDELFEKMAATIGKLKKLDETVSKIGYCFSYPTASRFNGDAILLEWTKGMDVSDMINEPVGEQLMKYLNSHRDIDTRFTDVKVINDTVACLFAGLKESGYDSYIGLIVGTGTNMASLMRLDKIEKLGNKSGTAIIPVNLESGNFNPPHLTVIDGLVDAMSDNKGKQRFEKAMSGKYIGEIFKTVFMYDKIKYDFDGGALAMILDEPAGHPAEQVEAAGWIYDRSAKLVAASLAGLVRVIVKHEPGTKNICLAADGSVFWGKIGGKTYYKDLVMRELDTLLPEGVRVTVIDEMKDPNLVGAAIAALS